MPRFIKGISGNPSGRPKGKKNRGTEEMRSIIRKFISGNIDQVQSDFTSLDPKDRLILFERLLRHVLPAPVDELERLSDEDLDRMIEKLKKDRLRVA